MPGMGERPSEKQSLHFDRTISVGHIITVLTLISAFVGAYAAYKVTITDHESRLIRLETMVLQQINSNEAQNNSLWSIKQDVAVIKDRIERFSDRK